MASNGQRLLIRPPSPFPAQHLSKQQTPSQAPIHRRRILRSDQRERRQQLRVKRSAGPRHQVQTPPRSSTSSLALVMDASSK